MKFGAIIQARTGSTRLPNKVLEELCGTPILEVIIQKAKTVRALDEVVVATSNKEGDDVIEDCARAAGVPCYRGSEDDVLQRFVDTANRYEFETVMRLTADCPLVSVKLMNEIVKRYNRYQARPDYYTIDGFPRGIGDIEIISRNALLKSARNTTEPFDREHVMPYIVRHPELFSIKVDDAGQMDSRFSRPDLRVCVDTTEDLEVVRQICEHFGRADVGILDLIRFLDSHPEIRKINADVRQKDAVPLGNHKPR